MVKRTRSRRRRASVPEFWSYVVRVSHSRPSYSFSINGVPRNEGPYWEYAGLEIVGECLAPASLATLPVMLTLFGSREDALALSEPSSNREPLGVGTLRQQQGQLQYFGSVPFDAFWGLAGLLATGTIGYVSLHGERLRYRKAMIRSLDLTQDLDPDEIEAASVGAEGR